MAQAMTPAERYATYGYGASPEELAQLNAELAAYKVAHPEHDPQQALPGMPSASRARRTAAQPWETRPGGFSLEDIYVPPAGTQPVTMAGRRLADVLTPGDVEQIRQTWNADQMARLLQARDTGAIIRDPGATATVTVQPASDVRAFRGEGRFPYDPTPFLGIESTQTGTGPQAEEWWRAQGQTGYNKRTPTAMIPGMPDWMIGAGLGTLLAGGGLAAGLLLPAAGGAAAGAAGAAGAGTAAGAGAGAAAAAPSLFGVPLSTLGTIGTVSSLGGTGANLLGAATGQDWLQKLGMGLGVAGGLAGGIGGLANVASTGVRSLADVARLASSAGKLTGVLGTLSNADVLRQAGGYLGLAGGLTGGTSTLANLATSGVHSLSDAARLAGGVGQLASAAGRLSGNRSLGQASGLLNMGLQLSGGVQGLLGAAQQAQQQGTGPVQRTMSDTDWLRWRGQPGPWQQA